MSGPSRPVAPGDDPALDPGVLQGPVLEWHGWQAVRAQGGTAVLPWRGDHLAARAAGVASVSAASGLAPGGPTQALVRIQKGKDATWAALRAAWDLLTPGGRLLVTGGNDLGIATWVKRVGQALQQTGEVLANHSHARVAVFARTAAALPPAEASPQVPLHPAEAGAPPPPRIVVPPGVFGHRGLDGGTALLLARLAQEAPAARVLDLGCGGGHLGLGALRRWPAARACFLDADARAIEAVQANLSQLGLAPRAEVAWWDVCEPLPAADFDLVLSNPPCHAGADVDYTTARAMFRCAALALRPGGRLLVVANRQLPYEHELRAYGVLETLVQQDGFKLLALVRDRSLDASEAEKA